MSLVTMRFQVQGPGLGLGVGVQFAVRGGLGYGRNQDPALS